MVRLDRIPARLNVIVPMNEYIEKMTEALERLILPRLSEKNTLRQIPVRGASADLAPEKTSSRGEVD
jgi:hypothetical protein